MIQQIKHQKRLEYIKKKTIHFNGQIFEPKDRPPKYLPFDESGHYILYQDDEMLDDTIIAKNKDTL